MKSTCIKHPGKEPLIILRKWQVEACDGDKCAGLLLSFFEYWHNIKLEQQIKARETNDTAEKHDDGRTQDESLYQFHTEKQLEEGLIGLYGRTKIKEALDLLAAKGFISMHTNPNSKYKFDRTRHFLFHDDAVNEWIVVCRSTENGAQSTENGAAIPEITTEITIDNKNPCASKAARRIALDKKNEAAIKNEANALFENLWQLYPRKKGKGSVSDTQKKKLLKAGREQLERCIERFKSDMEKEMRPMDKQLYGSTFFNSGYVDYLDKNHNEADRFADIPTEHLTKEQRRIRGY